PRPRAGPRAAAGEPHPGRRCAAAAGDRADARSLPRDQAPGARVSDVAYDPRSVQPKPRPAQARSVGFRREREASWQRLERIVARVERQGLRSLNEAELLALPSLHRAAMSALSVARAISLDRNLLEFLESLTARSHF